MAETRTPDLFDRLLARTGAVSRPDAVAPLARPRLAMPFERLPTAAPTEVQAEVEVEIDATAPSRPGPEASAAPQATARSGPREVLGRPSVLSLIERTVRSIETVRNTSPGAPVVVRAAAPVVLHNVVERLVPPPDAVAAAIGRSASQGTAADTPTRPPSAVRPAAAGRTAAAAHPSVAPTAGAVRRHEAQTAPVEPSVQVSIGRLEVTTAAHEPRRERRGRTGRPEPAVGLDAFLNRQEAT
ncbi:hypothetical protein [Streptomyces albipurpureus]|uniref:Uncharacterized protein n=1 Tax=Streptomyces albipurpureus TaxID=2897419 RepID=A0ABT0UH90_9ACTN|nr:hypothetical protein [Streptomyces sp. CWNU-1]MCM2387470.1 hypothetical protein [Streptomyces sp. CWNU-1]